MSKENSYRQILRSTSIIGGASILNILFSIIRTKAAAMLLGPAGIGLIGLLQNLMSTASTIAALGFGNAGTRQIAEAVGEGNSESISVSRRALFWGTLALSIVGAGLFWSLRDFLAEHVLGDSSLAPEVGWVAIGVLMTVASGSQIALLNGLRKIGDIARVTIFSATLSTLLGVVALLLLGKGGLAAFVIATPLASLLFGHFYVAKLPRANASSVPTSQMFHQWHELARLGVAFMVAGLATTVGQLVVRTMIQRQLGSNELGQFQAAWAISMSYVGIILSAMGTDYYPRLTAVINDRASVNRLVNEQVEIALLLASPVLLIMLGAASYVIELLYSNEFTEATAILRWQILGDVLKIASFPLAFIMLASGSGRTYMLAELAAIAVFILLTWLGLPKLGIRATGLAFLGMYAFYLAIVQILAFRRSAFKWEATVKVQFVTLFVTAALLHVVADQSVTAGLVTGIVASALFAAYAIKRLSALGGPIPIILGRLRDLVSRHKGRQ